MKVINKNNSTVCYARVNSNGWAVVSKDEVTLYTEREFSDNYIILL